MTDKTKYTVEFNKTPEGITASSKTSPENYYAEKLSEMSDSIGKHDEVIKTLSNYITQEIKKIHDNQKQTTKLIEEFKKDKHNLIEILGIFVGIFTFLSIEIQILRNVTDFLRIAGLSIISFSGLIFFNITLFIFGERWLNKTTEFTGLKRYYLLVFLSLFIGILLVSIGDYKNPANIKNNMNFIALEELVNKNKEAINQLEAHLSSTKECNCRLSQSTKTNKNKGIENISNGKTKTTTR
ncbi:TPA: hypothetical protein JBI63_11475 [Legionella pneumophila]|uniref:hypothetical protein n=1 Tax=Legionella pneumophila TaxID=446 RepID=UPI000778155F|nr:hypothetical protein [Legionella pneumophila]HAT8267598.1 hypothetical protein [Legionella pneumophila]HAU1452631.1 hypothetical protein [Legionella pneumophila]HAU1471627.1 hypothetical protein [Legionella pneumophila]HEO1452222.1 hypothetical protein [Legionella pneumophila]